MSFPFKQMLSSYKRRVRQSVAMPSVFYHYAPIAQVFINQPDKKTTYTFVNFPSLFAPTNAVACTYDLVLFDPQGHRVGSKSISIPAFGSVAVRPNSLFAGHALPDYGMLSARIHPDQGFLARYPHMIDLTSHFYALYHDDEMRSFAMVHPQTVFSVAPFPDEHWNSELQIQSKGLRAVEVYQINPSRSAVSTTLRFYDEHRSLQQEVPATLPPYGSRRVIFSPGDHLKMDKSSIGLVGMTGQNAKPLLFNIFTDGSFSASHS